MLLRRLLLLLRLLCRRASPERRWRRLLEPDVEGSEVVDRRHELHPDVLPPFDGDGHLVDKGEDALD